MTRVFYLLGVSRIRAEGKGVRLTFWNNLLIPL